MIKNTKGALLLVAMAGLSLTACNTGTEPGDTNTERSDIEHPNQQKSNANRQYADDTTNMEHFYEGRDSTAFNEGAYDQDGQHEKRGQ